MSKVFVTNLNNYNCCELKGVENIDYCPVCSKQLITEVNPLNSLGKVTETAICDYCNVSYSKIYD